MRSTPDPPAPDREREYESLVASAFRRKSCAAAVALFLVLSFPAPSAAQSPRTAPADAAAFDEVARQAADARQQGRLDEAVSAYKRAVHLRPGWDEGWWYLATLLYEQEQDAAARDAFTRFLALKPEAGPGFALRGICEFRLRRYDHALADLYKARTLGVGSNAELKRTTTWYTAILLLRQGQFELAVDLLTFLARSEPEHASLVEAAGLLILRLPYLPEDVPAEKRALVRAAGQAGYAWLARDEAEARKRFDALVAEYPHVPFVHYAHGVFLLKGDGDAAIAALQREIAVNPHTSLPHLEIAFELLRRGDPAAARPNAERAVKLDPDLAAARNALGRTLVELGELDAGIRELELAVRLAPQSPEMHFALANAYARAGRKEDAARVREIFLKLNQTRDRG